MGRGLDRHRLRERLDALVDAGEVGDVGQLLLDDLATEVAHVEVEVVLAADAAPGPDLLVHRPTDHVARGQLHQLGRVALHEALAQVVEERAALAAGRLGEQDADAHDPGRVELEELHVLERDAVAVAQGHAVAGQAVGVGRDPEHPPEAAGGEQDRLGPEGVELPVGDAVGHDPGGSPALRGLAALEEQIHDLVLVEELDAVLDALLVERLQDHVAGSIGREAGPPDGRLAVVAGVAAELALVDLAVRRAVERQAHVLELDDRLDRLAGEHLGGVLVDQVVAALDGVEHVPLPVVLLEVAESGADTALGGAGVGAGGIQLRQDGGVDAFAGQLESGPQAGAAGADDDRIERVVHRSSSAS